MIRARHNNTSDRKSARPIINTRRHESSDLIPTYGNNIYQIPYSQAIQHKDVGSLANESMNLRELAGLNKLDNVSTVALYDPRVGNDNLISYISGYNLGEGLGGHSERHSKLEASRIAYDKFFGRPSEQMRNVPLDNSHILSSMHDFNQVSDMVPLLREFSERQSCGNYANGNQGCSEFNNNILQDTFDPYSESLINYPAGRESYYYYSVPTDRRDRMTKNLNEQIKEAHKVPQQQRNTHFPGKIPDSYYRSIIPNRTIRNIFQDNDMSMYDHKNNYRDDR